MHTLFRAFPSKYEYYDGCVLLFNAENNTITGESATNHVLLLAKKHALTDVMLKKRCNMEIRDIKDNIKKMMESKKASDLLKDIVEMTIKKLTGEILRMTKLVEEKKKATMEDAL